MTTYTCNVAIYAAPGSSDVLSRDQAAANALIPLAQPSGGLVSNPEDAGKSVTPRTAYHSIFLALLGIKVTLDVQIGDPPTTYSLIVDRSM